MIPEEVVQKMCEAAEAYLDEVVGENPVIKVISGDFPVIAEHNDKYYKATFIMTSLKGEYIYKPIDFEEITINEFIDFQQNNTLGFDTLSLN